MSSVFIMDPVDINGRKTLEDLRKEAKLQKSDVYRGVGVSRRTYDRWIEGRTLPDISKGLALAKILEVPFVSVCRAFGVETDGILLDDVPKGTSESPSGPMEGRDYESLLQALRSLPDEQATAVVRLLFNKNDGREPPPSQMPS